MNMVGREGKGESVWLAFFMHEVLGRFSRIAQVRNDQDFSRAVRERGRQAPP